MKNSTDYLNHFNQLLMPNISKIQRLSAPLLEEALNSQEMTPAEFRIIGLLMDEETGLSQKELASKLNITAPSLSATVSKLEAKQMIQRINDSQDQRIKRIALMPKIDFKPVAQLIGTLESQATQGIGQSDLKTAHQVLQKILTNLHSM